MIIPSSYIRHDLLPVHYEFEILQALGQALDFCGQPLRPPFPAYFSLLDLADNRFYADPKNSTLEDFTFAIWLLNAPRRLAVQAALDKNAGRRVSFDDSFYREEMTEPDNMLRALAWIREVPASGFSLIPDTGEGSPRLPSPYMYDAHWLGFIVRAYCRITCEPAARALWRTPVCRIGHVIASDAESNGANLRRPEDRESIRRQIAEAEAREARGELHPWQRDNPNNPLYFPSAAQIAANFEIIREFENLKKKTKDL